jgi:uncharacterized protein
MASRGEPSHVEIAVPDPGRARTFYGALLGWTFQETANGASVDTGGAVRAGIHSEQAPSTQVFFSVPDIDAAVQRVRELGGEVDPGSSEGPGGRYVHSCRDDQGAPFGLHQPTSD